MIVCFLMWPGIPCNKGSLIPRAEQGGKERGKVEERKKKRRKRRRNPRRRRKRKNMTCQG